MTHQGKNATITEVSKDRLWKDYVAREANHQTYWAVEAQFVKGSLSPEKKNILRNVDALGDFDATVLLGTGRRQHQQQGSAPGSPTAHFNSTNTFKTNSNPNAPSNLLLRQLQMTAAENTQAEEKTLQQLKSYRHMYSSRAGLKHKRKQAEAEAQKMSSQSSNPYDDGDNQNDHEDDHHLPSVKPSSASSPSKVGRRDNIPTPLSPNAVFLGSTTASAASSPYHRINSSNACSPLATTRGAGAVAAAAGKEQTLNNSYCSYYANKDIGIHHYHYNPPARSCQGEEGAVPASPLKQHYNQHLLGSGAGSPMASLNGTVTSATASPHGLPPLALGGTRGGVHGGAMHSARSLSPLTSSRAFQHEMELEASIVSPKRTYAEHGLLTPAMGVRIASATGRRGYGQRIASAHEEAYAVRPAVELNERSPHGYRKWN